MLCRLRIPGHHNHLIFNFLVGNNMADARNYEVEATLALLNLEY